MKDVLDHMSECFDQWQLADSQNERFLAGAVERDLEELRRLCASLQREAQPPLRRQAVAA
jgi:hypothetical protein